MYLNTSSFVRPLLAADSSIVTIGPMVLLCFLSITFHFGSRTGISDIPRRRRKWPLTASFSRLSDRVSLLSGKQPPAKRGDVGALHAPAAVDIEGEEEKYGEFSLMSPGPKTRGIFLSHQSVRSVWNAGPGDDPESDQVTP